MEKQVNNKFTWVIKNFSSLQSEKIYSDQFVIDGCKWHLLAYPKGLNKDKNLSLFLEVADSKTLPCGWRRHTKFSLTIVNQIPANLSQLRETQHWFDEKSSTWGFPPMFPLSELHPKKFLVNGELKIVAEIDVLEVIGKLDVVKGSMEVNGFQVLPSQVKFVNRLFERHPDIASNLHIKNQHLKTGYMNVLLSLIETLHQSPQQISKDDLADAYAALGSLADAGFRLDWLEKKLDEMSVKKKKEEACETRMQELDEELEGLKHKCSDVEALMEMEKEELLGARAPLSNDDIF